MTAKVKGMPTLTTVRAVLTTRWAKNVYRPHIVKTVESYYVDTALDNDADSWSINVGDPEGDMMEMLRRDSEVRVQLYGYSPAGSEPIMTGIADEINFTEEGVWSITGRDLSSLAMDCTIPPAFFKHAMAYSLVRRQALQLGYTKTNLATGLGGVKIVKKTQHTDGNESYWEFWYRLYRKEKMWLWTEPDGTLKAADLNYSGPPFYFFGTARASDSRAVKKQHLPVEHVTITKGTQQRFQEVWVHWHRGDNGHWAKKTDPGMKDWIKKPLKIMEDTDARTPKSAAKTALEEIFEGKVGEIEYKIIIPDPGYELHQNRIARLRVPELGIETDMFVVGIRRSGGTDGVTLEVRLRERHYAISSRVPKDPVINRNVPGSTDVITGLGDQLPGIADIPPGWSGFFVEAARQNCGPWDFNLFLACLLGICRQESNFRNIRQVGYGGEDRVDWYLWRSAGSESPNRPPSSRDSHGRTLQEWQAIFANEPNSYGVGSDNVGAGPMQLTSLGLKQTADKMKPNGKVDQYVGGRWVPEYNIMEAAHYLHECLKARTGDSGHDEDVWDGVESYNAGPGGRNATYRQSVKNWTLIDPNYLQQVKDARAQAVEDAKANQDSDDPGDFTAPFYNSPADLKKLTHLQVAPGKDIAHVNWILLSRLNSWGRKAGKKVYITSGYRSMKEQQDLWDSHVRTGVPKTVANPANGPSNHNLGEACDCTVDGVGMGQQPSVSLEASKIHAWVYHTIGTDDVHITRIEITG